MEDNRIVELLTEMLQKQDESIHQQKEMNVQLGKIEHRLEGVETRIDRLDEHQRSTNLKLQEQSLSFLRVADELKFVRLFGERVARLEAKVFH